MNHLKSNGQKVQTLKKIYGFIHDNIDYFYDNENLRNKFLKKHKIAKGDN